MDKIIKLILLLMKPISIVFIDQYKQIDQLRTDDSPFQTLCLYIAVLMGEFCALYFIIKLIGIDKLME